MAYKMGSISSAAASTAGSKRRPRMGRLLKAKGRGKGVGPRARGMGRKVRARRRGAGRGKPVALPGVGGPAMGAVTKPKKKTVVKKPKSTIKIGLM
jgi:hypothetical protein